MPADKNLSSAVNRAVNEAVALQPSRSEDLIGLVALILRQQQQPKITGNDYYAKHKAALEVALHTAVKEATSLREPWDDDAAIMELVADSLSRQAHKQQQQQPRARPVLQGLSG